MTIYRPCAGDVVRYTPTDRWCREGIAIAQDRTNLTGRAVLLDTYWGNTEPRALTDAEADTAELMFKLADYTELDPYLYSSPATWDTYAPADRQLITEQHGCRKRWFIRKGAQPDWATQIANARGVVSARELELASAERRLRWAQEDLVRVLAAADAAEADHG